MSKTKKILIVVSVSVVTWLVCSCITSMSMAQVLSTVPLEVKVCKGIYKILHFPWSWLPRHYFTWGRTGMASVRPISTTIGLLWAIPAGLLTLLLLRRRKSKT